MSNDLQWLDWFKENYPREADMQEQITKRLEEIFRTVPEKMPEGKIIQAMVGLTQNPATGKLGIAINPTGAVFLGALGKAVLDSLTAHFEALLSSGIGEQLVEEKVKEAMEQHFEKISKQNSPRCKSCGAKNRMFARFCDQCAEELVDK